MPTILEQIENFLGYLLSNQKGRDSKLFVKSAPFASHPDQDITVTSPELGESGSSMTIDHTPFGANACPELSWTWKKQPSQTPVEYAVVVEDPDAPLPSPIVHGLFHSIPASKTTLVRSDFEVADEASATLKGGFKYGLNRRGTVYGGARPVLGHGAHRYFYQVVALSEKIGDAEGATKMSKDELLQKISAKVIGWGNWIGTYERKLA